MQGVERCDLHNGAVFHPLAAAPVHIQHHAGDGAAKRAGAKLGGCHEQFLLRLPGRFEGLRLARIGCFEVGARLVDRLRRHELLAKEILRPFELALREFVCFAGGLKLGGRIGAGRCQVVVRSLEVCAQSGEHLVRRHDLSALDMDLLDDPDGGAAELDDVGGCHKAAKGLGACLLRERDERAACKLQCDARYPDREKT